MSFKIDLGDRILKIRKELKLKQEEFCNKLNIDITRASLSRIESGNQLPSAEIIKSIIETYNVSPYWLLDIDEPLKDEYILKYESLNYKDKETVNLMIDHLYSNSSNLYTSMNTEGEGDKKSS